MQKRSGNSFKDSINSVVIFGGITLKFKQNSLMEGCGRYRMKKMDDSYRMKKVNGWTECFVMKDHYTNEEIEDFIEEMLDKDFRVYDRLAEI